MDATRRLRAGRVDQRVCSAATPTGGARSGSPSTTSSSRRCAASPASSATTSPSSARPASGRTSTLAEVADELARRLVATVPRRRHRPPAGVRPVREVPDRPGLARAASRSTSTSTATPAPASAPRTRPAGPGWSPTSSPAGRHRDVGPRPRSTGLQVAGVVPNGDDRPAPVVAEHGDGGGREQQGPGQRRPHVQPLRRQHPEQVPVREDGDVAAGGGQLGEDPLNPRRDVVERLTPRDPIGEEVPARALLAGISTARRPRTRRSPTPSGQRRSSGARRDRPSRRSPGARVSGLHHTWAKENARSRTPTSSAWRRPSSSRGRSVRPVWRPTRDDAVSPWRTRYARASPHRGRWGDASCDAGAMAKRTQDDPLERLRAICLALPEVTERLSHGAPTWFVRGQEDVRDPVGARAPSGTTSPTWSAPRRQACSRSWWRPSPSDSSGRPTSGAAGWLAVRLDVKVDWDEIAEICEEAYRVIAPRQRRTLLDD